MLYSGFLDTVRDLIEKLKQALGDTAPKELTELEQAAQKWEHAFDAAKRAAKASLYGTAVREGYGIFDLTQTKIQENKEPNAAIVNYPLPGTDRSTTLDLKNSINQNNDSTDPRYSLKMFEDGRRFDGCYHRTGAV